MEPRRRLSDLLGELSLMEAQLQLFHEGAGPHYGRNLGLRIAFPAFSTGGGDSE